MKNESLCAEQHHRFTARAILAGTTLFALLGAGLDARAGGTGARTAVSTSGCTKSASIGKGLPILITRPGTVEIPIVLNTCTGSLSHCTSQSNAVNCSEPATVVTGGTLDVVLSLIGGGSSAVHKKTGFPIPTRSSGFVSKTIKVPVTIPAGARIGSYAVKCTGIVSFSKDGSNPAQKYQVSGDTVISYVASIPGDPSVPRLEVKALGRPTRNALPGQPLALRFRIKNNDAKLEATVQASLSSRQSARLPRLIEGGGKRAVFSFAAAIGQEAFPVVIVADKQQPVFSVHKARVCSPSMTLKPREEVIVRAYTLPLEKSYNGACSEYRFQVTGKFGDHDPIDASVGTAVTANTFAGKLRMPWDEW